MDINWPLVALLCVIILFGSVIILSIMKKDDPEIGTETENTSTTEIENEEESSDIATTDIQPIEIEQPQEPEVPATEDVQEPEPFGNF
jgi:hypothetical protein